MKKEEIYNLMINEYRDACTEYYETQYGEKVNNEYTIKNRVTGEVIRGSVSGRHFDESSREAMRLIRRMMVQAFGEEVQETLKEIRQEERKKEKKYFEENPQFVYYVTCIQS